jgi:hypothetical protein
MRSKNPSNPSHRTPLLNFSFRKKYPKKQVTTKSKRLIMLTIFAGRYLYAKRNNTSHVERKSPARTGAKKSRFLYVLPICFFLCRKKAQIPNINAPIISKKSTVTGCIWSALIMYADIPNEIVQPMAQKSAKI